MNALERKRIMAFLERHGGCNVKGQRITYSHKSGIGANTLIHCLDCKVYKDVTDYESW